MIGKLEKLLELERQERVVTEKKSLELLNEVKQKWQEREEARVEKIQSALKKSESKRHKMESELMGANQILMGKEEEIASNYTIDPPGPRANRWSLFSYMVSVRPQIKTLDKRCMGPGGSLTIHKTCLVAIFV